MNNNENLTSEQLLYKSQGVKDCIKWIEEKMKNQKKSIENANELDNCYGIYDDCGSSYHDNLVEEKAKMEAMVSIKVGLEKYMKKLKHMADEVKDE